MNYADIQAACDTVLRANPVDVVVRFRMDPYAYMLLKFYEANEWRKPSKRQRRDMRIRAAGVRQAIKQEG